MRERSTEERGGRFVLGRKNREGFEVGIVFYSGFEGWIGNGCKGMREKGFEVEGRG